MSLNSVLDVIIALVFTYFLLALIASGVQEVIAGVFAWRGTYLAKGLDVILDNSSTASFRWVDARDFLRAHFTSAPGESAAERLAKVVARNPQGAPTPEQAVLQRVLGVSTHPLMRGTPSRLPSYIPARTFSLALLETLRDGSGAPVFAQFEHSVSGLPEGDLKKTLSMFLRDAGDDVDAFRARLEQWFNDAMDRVSGIYKRLSQYVMIILGVVLALALNVDSLRVARVLWQTPALRAAMLVDAQRVVDAQSLVAARSLVDAQRVVAAAPPPAAPQVGLSEAAVLAPLRVFEAQQIPFGWSVRHCSWATPCGWLLTAGAVALGAPFWFTLLQNLINIRNAGPKPRRFDELSAASE